MAYVTAAEWVPVEAAFGQPWEYRWTYPISRSEMDMVVGSTRGQRRLHDVTVFAFNRQGQVALVRKHGFPQGGWRVPGGGIDPGEDFVTGALREIREETGLTAKVERYLMRVHVTFTRGSLRQPWTTHVLAASTEEAVLEPEDVNEIQAARWGSLEELVGPVARVLESTGRGLFRYRIDLHQEAVAMLKIETEAP